MPEYVLNRDHDHRSTHGHIINFKKGVPVYVPPVCEREVVLFGAEPVTGDKPDLLEDMAPSEEEPQGEDRRALLLSAYEQLEARNQRGDFTGQGRPHPNAIKDLTGLKVETRERDEVWEEYKAAKSAGT